jgi:broad specificity phosphatase PhoE
MSRPAQVLIIRHGEKLGNPSDDTNGGPDLSVRGSSRAAALTSLFAPALYQSSELSCALATAPPGFTGSYIPVSIAGSQPRFATPDFIFATKKSHHSNRPVETITPLRSALNLGDDHYNDKHPDDDYATVASDILTNSKYEGKVVLICWHHGKIPALAQALGISAPPSWPDTVFDRVWQITWPAEQATLSVQCQMLLYGDTAC